MRNALIGIVAGLVIGVVLGVSVIAPRLKASLPETAVKVVAGLTAKEDHEPRETTPKLQASSTGPSVGLADVPSPIDTAISNFKNAGKENLLAPATNKGPGIKWRMESAFASSLPQLGSQAKRIETEIWRISDGTMEIALHEPGTLVRDADMFQAVKSGAIDAAFIPPDSWPKETPALQLFGAVPFGPRADEYLAWLYFGGGEKLLQGIATDVGVQVLVCGLISPEGSGWYRRPITTVDDLKGLRVRMTGLGARVLDQLGAKTVTLAEGEIFHALESGNIDAAEYSMPAIDQKLGLHRMAKNYYFPGWHQPTTLLSLVINQSRWENLSPVKKSQLRAVCGDNVRHGLAEGESLQYQALLSMTKAGVIVRRWPREILDRLEHAWAGVAAAEAKADKTFAKVWKSLTRFRRDYAVWRELGSR